MKHVSMKRPGLLFDLRLRLIFAVRLNLPGHDFNQVFEVVPCWVWGMLSATFDKVFNLLFHDRKNFGEKNDG